ncbi:MAG TPA: plastocyanin [Mycobacterium sp.]|nr:plastocyanin [Mycobacterium sp.]
MSAPTATPAPPRADIVISKFAFSVPAPVRPGQQVTVVNDDENAQSLVADTNNAFDVRVSGSGGISTFTAPTTPGAYRFHCKYHDGMRGTLTVQWARPMRRTMACAV